jgi:hypothetical protein
VSKTSCTRAPDPRRSHAVSPNHFDSPARLKVSASQHNVYNPCIIHVVLGYSIVSMTHTVQASKPQKTFASGSGALPHETECSSAGLCVLSTLGYADADMVSTVSSRRLIVHERQDGSKCRASSAMPTVPPAPHHLVPSSHNRQQKGASDADLHF